MKIRSLGLIVSALGVLTALSACSLLSNANNGTTVAAQLVIEEATAVAIQHGCSTTACYDANAAHVLVIAEQLQNATAATVLVAVQSAITAEINKLKLTPEQVIPLQALTSLVMNYLTPLISTNSVLSTASLVLVRTVAGWVVTEASLYSPVAVSNARVAGRLAP
jgi:hypothetical protein